MTEKLTGLHVLYALRDIELSDAAVPYVFATEIAQKVGAKDGRAVTPKLQRLEQAGLVQRWPSYTNPNWRTTTRGRTVESLCSAADASRGGKPAPFIEFLPKIDERLALRL